ncbi:DUF503 domain-containing protein [bacterium]|nr:DUF503 domain-containing protein [bacterium]
MIVGTMLLDLFLPGASSLKEKRMILKSYKAKIRNQFNVSVAEVGFHDKWQRSTIGIAVVANERRFIDEVLSSVSRFIERDGRVEITREEIAIL